jgi:hypothetical protein
MSGLPELLWEFVVDPAALPRWSPIAQIFCPLMSIRAPYLTDSTV